MFPSYTESSLRDLSIQQVSSHNSYIIAAINNHPRTNLSSFSLSRSLLLPCLLGFSSCLLSAGFSFSFFLFSRLVQILPFFLGCSVLPLFLSLILSLSLSLAFSVSCPLSVRSFSFLPSCSVPHLLNTGIG